MTRAAASVRGGRLADRLEANAKALMEFATSLSADEWRKAMPGDGRTFGVIVHHVASIYPLEIQLAQATAAGTAMVGVVWQNVHDINAAHASLQERGVGVSEIQQFPWGDFVFFSDPDGNNWSVQAIPAR